MIGVSTSATSDDDKKAHPVLIRVPSLGNDDAQNAAPIGGASVTPKSEGKKAGFVELKDLRPSVFNDRDEDWKLWSDNIKRFLDATKNGMRHFHTGIEKSNTTITDFPFWSSQQFVLQRTVDCQAMVNERVNLRRALKAFTDSKSDARRVIMTA